MKDKIIFTLTTWGLKASSAVSKALFPIYKPLKPVVDPVALPIGLLVIAGLKPMFDKVIWPALKPVMGHVVLDIKNYLVEDIELNEVIVTELIDDTIDHFDLHHLNLRRALVGDEAWVEAAVEGEVDGAVEDYYLTVGYNPVKVAESITIVSESEDSEIQELFGFGQLRATYDFVIKEESNEL